MVGSFPCRPPMTLSRVFGGMDVSDARRLKAIEGENAKLWMLLAEAMLDKFFEFVDVSLNERMEL